MLQQESLDKLDRFFSQYKPLQYKPRSVISLACDTSSSIFYIKNGFLRVFRISEQGEELTLTILKPKDFFPLTFGMINSSRHSYYLEAITSLEIWKVNIDQFHQFINNEPEVYLELTKKVFVRFNDIVSKMEYLVFNNAHTKIMATIISCAQKFGEKYGDDILINVPLTHKDIATLVGITRETTSLEMKKLEKLGYITRHGKCMIVKNLNKLEKEIKIQTGRNNQQSYSL